VLHPYVQMYYLQCTLRFCHETLVQFDLGSIPVLFHVPGTSTSEQVTRRGTYNPTNPSSEVRSLEDGKRMRARERSSMLEEQKRKVDRQPSSLYKSGFATNRVRCSRMIRLANRPPNVAACRTGTLLGKVKYLRTRSNVSQSERSPHIDTAGSPGTYSSKSDPFNARCVLQLSVM
jgi:hypothetical protein